MRPPEATVCQFPRPSRDNPEQRRRDYGPAASRAGRSAGPATGVGRALALALALALAALAGCVEPRITECPTVACPYDEVCDGRGGCAPPEALAACAGQADGTACSYDQVPEGACSDGLCLPMGCGNQFLTGAEVCDDGNTVNGDGCSADCLSDETCGNAIVDPAGGEQCDDGNVVDGDGCQRDCRNPRCGDGVVDATLNEACDDGAGNTDAPDGACRSNCQPRRCGDGTVDTAEVCDDGNVGGADGCSGDCRSDETCGNGVVDVAAGERCDDGNATAGDGCSADCRVIETCGNGVFEAERQEVCDDGNTVNGDGCSADCRSDETCGNGYVDFAREEQCDLGAENSDQPDAECRTSCELPRCGDGIEDRLRGETCDLGEGNSDEPGEDCRSNCQPRRCGDGVMDEPGEVCDDGDAVSGDGCSADCLSLEVCGNGYVDFAAGEVCDDANLDDDDACHTDCRFPACGDGIVDPGYGEQCDDGVGPDGENSDAPDAACRPDCRARRCGDGVVDVGSGEVCDDGNLVLDDACRPDCQSTNACGNGVLDLAVGERCDDGNTRSRDGCSLCREEAVVVSSAGLVPSARSSAQLAYDPLRQRVLLFGGFAGVALADTWEWDGSAWARLEPERSPPARSDASIAYDAARRRIVMFGGASNGGFRRDTWEWDGVRWIERTPPPPAPSPAARRQAAMAYDGSRGLVVLFGGFDSVGGDVVTYGDTWTWDGAGWTQASAGIAVGARAGSTMAYDAARQQLYLWGGAGADDTVFRWDYLAGRWMSLGPSGGPPRSDRAAAAYDPFRARLVVTAQTTDATWEWDGSAWSSAPAPGVSATPGASAAYDVARRQLVQVGSTGAWLRTETTWARPPTPVSPRARFGAGAVFDPLRGVVVVLGGAEVFGAEAGSTETWEWNGSTWHAPAPTRSPRARRNAQLVYDEAGRRVVMVGGVVNGVADASLEAYDGARWEALSATGLPALRNPAVATSGSAGGVVVFGGRVGVVERGDDTWRWDPASGWFLDEVDARPPASSGAAMAFDPIRQAHVLFGGKDPFSRLVAGTWVNAGSGWTLASDAGPLSRVGTSLVFDPDAGKVVLFGGAPDVAEDLWEWDGDGWQQRGLPSTVTPVYRAAVAYDALRHQLVVFGGRDAGGRPSSATRLVQYRPNVAVEACLVDLDYDDDGLAGCDDPDCWAQCTPLCPPAMPASCPATTPRCGDGECLGTETCGLCPEDCGACTSGVCGDFVCAAGGPDASCPLDCAP
jgi:cysteine-rich repeat protein